MSEDDEKEFATVVGHEQALKVYIDALLLEPAPEESSSADGGAQAPGASPAEAAAAPLQEETSAVEPQTEMPLQRAPVADADAPFDCLLFKVAGALLLAVPLVRLAGIMKWRGEVTPIPGYAEWFLGLTPNRGRQVKVIDIARFVIPENHKSRQALAGERRFKHLLLIDDGGIGLACDDLGQVLKLTADKVRWRKESRSRPWLAGTLIEQMSALLDVERLTAMLKEGAPADDIT